METKKIKKYKITRSALLGIGMVNEFIRRVFGLFIDLRYLDLEEIKYPGEGKCVINFKTYISTQQGGANLFFTCQLKKKENEWAPEECIMDWSGERKIIYFWRLSSSTLVYTAGDIQPIR